jgi:hypothetical protein
MAEFHAVLRHNLPASGSFGDVYFCTDTKDCFCVFSDGSLVLVNGGIFVDKSQMVGIGPQGVPGPAGDSPLADISDELRTFVQQHLVLINGVLQVKLDVGVF